MRFIVLCLAILAFATTQAHAADPLKGLKPADLGSVDGEGVYRLSAEEEAYDCKKLTGRMQVRILEIRDHEERQQASALAQGLRSMSSLFGSGSAPTTAGARHKADRAMLEAYNGRLAAKNCRTFDLGAELRPKPLLETPTPRSRDKTP